MNETSYLVAITVSDIHLSHVPPPCRAKEPCWYSAMFRAITRLKTIRDNLDKRLPIIVAGDIFDKWNPPHELVNFALTNLPQVYAVPGQHDLPHHSLEDIKRSAYWTLVEAGRVYHLGYNVPVGAGECMLWGFPWGTELKPLPKSHPLCLDIAVVHHLIYTQKTGFPGAPEGSRAKILRDKLQGFEVAVFGDNHKGFFLNKKEGLPTVLNNGGFMRRRSDEEDYIPCVGIIYRDGTVERIPLDSEEVFERVESRNNSDHSDFTELLGGLSNLSEVTCDFKEEIRRELARREPTQRVKDIIWTATETTK